MTRLGQARLSRLWEAVQRTSHEVVFELEPDGTIGFVTEPVADIMGISAEELNGRNPFSLVHPDDVERVAGVLTECMDRGAGWQGLQVRVVRPDGQVVWIESSSLAHNGPSGLVGFTATARRLESHDARAARLLEVRERTERVLRERSLVTVWQTIFSLEEGGIVGVEALSRFPGSPAGPERWFSEAAEVGLGDELELLAIETALGQTATLPDDVYVALNVSPDTVASGRLQPALRGASLDPGRVVLELTEHTSIENYEAVAGALAALRDSGVQLAVDDAGAGFASFRHILKLEPDVIKVDRSITQGIAANPAQRALAMAIVLYCFEVGSTTVVAEGVETSDDLATVSSLGIDAAQGFHLGHPVALAHVDWSARLPAMRAPHRSRRQLA